jgi:hypothetical protein
LLRTISCRLAACHFSSKNIDHRGWLES